MKRLVAISGAACVCALSALALTAQGQDRVGQIEVGGTPRVSAADAAGPVPRLPDGTVDLTGPWVGGGSNGDIERDGGLKPGELPLLPWAKALRDSRREEHEPYLYCTPMSVPRVNPYPWKMAMTYTQKGLTHIYILHETGDAGAHRVVYMDGRPHPEDPVPTWWGHSIGRFDGDTLVIHGSAHPQQGELVECRLRRDHRVRERCDPISDLRTRISAIAAPPRSAAAGRIGVPERERGRGPHEPQGAGRQQSVQCERSLQIHERARGQPAIGDSRGVRIQIRRPPLRSTARQISQPQALTITASAA